MELSRGSKLDGVPKLVRFQPIPTLFAEEGLRETRQASSLEKVGQFYPSAQHTYTTHSVKGDEMILRTMIFKRGYLSLLYTSDYQNPPAVFPSAGFFMPTDKMSGCLQM